jgi:hypothetical protein
MIFSVRDVFSVRDIFLAFTKNAEDAWKNLSALCFWKIKLTTPMFGPLQAHSSRS